MDIDFCNYTIKTSRLIIRPITNSDFEKCSMTREISKLSTEEMNGNNLAISNIEIYEFEAMVSYRNFHIQENSQYILGIFLNSTSQFIGDILLYNILEIDRVEASVGLIIHSPFRRKGLAKEALLGLFHLAFNYLKIERIEGQANPNNWISIKLCQSVGMIIEGNRMIYNPIKNIDEEMVILSIKKEEQY